MTTYSRQVSPSPATGDSITAAHLNTDMDYIYGTILSGGITADQLAAGSVDTSELASDSVTTAKITDANVTTAKLAADAVTAAKLADNAVVTANIDTSGAFGVFGTRTTNDSTSTAIAVTEVYKVGTDGWLTAASTATNHSQAQLELYYGSTTAPSTLIHAQATYQSGHGIGVCGFIKKGEYFKITDVSSYAGTVNIYWLPIGTGTCVKQ